MALHGGINDINDINLRVRHEAAVLEAALLGAAVLEVTILEATVLEATV